MAMGGSAQRQAKVDFLPVCRADMEARGWGELDFLFVNGDAYVDHPSFAVGLISRLLEREGYRVGVAAQPNWRGDEDFTCMGRPRLGVLVGAGNLDSMLGKLTAGKKARRTDVYSPGGAVGLRPDRATIVYCQQVRRIFGDIPLIIGGIEASLRRLVHYDYWSDSLRRSILLDSQADLLIYGMGERQLLEIAAMLKRGVPVGKIRDVRGTCYVAERGQEPSDSVSLPSWDEIVRDRRKFAEAFRLASLEQDALRGRTLLQGHEKGTLVQLPPAPPLTEAEMDGVYDMPYLRRWHPKYDALGGVPALAEVKFSVTSHRGCFGSCAFCAIHAHQGRIIQARSHESILREVRALTRLPDFKGYVHDVGGPTANFRHPSCKDQLERGVCRGKECLFPTPCRRLDASHEDYLALLRKCRAVPGVKKVFVRSGLRYDYLLLDGAHGEAFLRELCEHHVSGQLKVAPEHASPAVLRVMRKGSIEQYRRFMKLYEECNRKLGKKQYLVPYFMTSHPGSGVSEAIELAEFAAELSFCPEQAQDFIPTPGSLATCMYYTGLDPFTGAPVRVVRRESERREQRALLQHRMPQNKRLVLEVLRREGRTDCAAKLYPDGRGGHQNGAPASGAAPTRRAGRRGRSKGSRTAS
ncbi:YgiQ family radical SAM protein [uncultured Fretibacterium sp.]|uniref:YgiQ family radical SAM protein n=1 Tax=uncultured Fretibacterium sp. TaxID=1678694 RepID=UPI002630DB23|nr:YgiQ family radical SAM protein [uncultured Fretibacterium sp.]